MKARAEALFVYPVKACAGLRVPQLCFTADGRIEGDREWIVTDADGQAAWQGSHPRLARVRPAFEDAMLVLRADGVAPLPVPRMSVQAPCEATIWNGAAQRNDCFAAFDAGPGARAFLQAVTGADLRLLRLDSPALVRDGVSPLHLLSRESLAELDALLQARGEPAAELARFRPNLLLAGIDDRFLPFLEEHASHIRWTRAGVPGELRITERCVRCIVPNVDPATGEVNPGPVPTVAALSAQRWPGAPSTLGLYARPAGAAVLAVGDALELDLLL